MPTRGYKALVISLALYATILLSAQAGCAAIAAPLAVKISAGPEVWALHGFATTAAIDGHGVDFDLAGVGLKSMIIGRESATITTS